MVKGEFVTIAPHYVSQIMADVIGGYQTGFSKASFKVAAAIRKLITADTSHRLRIDYKMNVGQLGCE